MLCIRRILTQGRLAGSVSGFGAATADALYAAVAAFGVTFVSVTLVDHQLWLRLLAGLFLLYLGTKVFLAHPALQPEPPRIMGLIGNFASVFLLALSNPMVILSLAAIFSAFDLTVQEGGFASVGLLVLGVFSGSALWWVILSLAYTVFRVKFNEEGIRWINRTSGVVITGFGLLVLLSLSLWKRG